MIIKLSQDQYEELVNQAQKELPQEACGLVGGVTNEADTGGQGRKEIEVKEVYPMTNVDESQEHFSMDPEEQFAVAKEIRNKDQEIIGNYHSHPSTPSRPSQEDKRLAYDDKMIYFILSLQQKESPVLKAFKIKDQQEVTEIEIELID